MVGWQVPLRDTGGLVVIVCFAAGIEVLGPGRGGFPLRDTRGFVVIVRLAIWCLVGLPRHPPPVLTLLTAQCPQF